MGIREEIKKPLISWRHKLYKQELNEKKITYDRWIKELEEGKLPLHGNPSDADLITDGIYFIKTVPGELAIGAKEKILREFSRHPETVLIYGDEDIADPVRRNPWFKPDWSPDTFLTNFYLGGLIAIRQSALPQGMSEKEIESNIKAVCYQVVKSYGGFSKRIDGLFPVIHISEVLFHRSEEYKETEQIKKIVIEDSTKNLPNMVSIIIPSKDNMKCLLHCINSIKKTVHRVNYELIVVDNGSKPEIKEALSQEDFTYIYVPMEFNFAKMCNIGASHAKGDFLLFLNDDVECVDNGWLEEMAQIGVKDYVGAVGIKLLYPDLTKIQHAGITNLPMGPVHKLQFLEDTQSYYFGANRGNRNVLAVTGACLLVKRSLFEQAGAMNEELKVAFNDVDLCYSLYDMGYYNVVVNDKFLYHHESLSRGEDESPDKWKRLMKERKLLYSRHPALDGKDPFYNEHLNIEGLDTRILPGYVCADVNWHMTTPVKAGQFVDSARTDACLLVRLEECLEGRMAGYGVVLGSDNSLFQKTLLLKDEEGNVWELPFHNRYRSDLEENMSDQKNVALCGFRIIVKQENLQKGIYQVGMSAKDTTSRLHIINWTNRFLEVRGTL